MRVRSAAFLLMLLGPMAPVAMSAPLPGDGPIYDAVDYMAALFAKDAAAMPDHDSVAVAGLAVSGNLSDDIGGYLLSRIEATMGPEGKPRFVQCKDCMALRAEVMGDQVVIKKGVTEQKDLIRFAGQLGVKEYAQVNLAYTGTRAHLQVNAYDAANGSLKWAKSYDTRVLQLAKAGFTIGLSLAQMVAFGDVTSFPMALSAIAAERLYGVGSFGIGGLATTRELDGRSYVSVGPVLALNVNELAQKPWSWGACLVTLRVNYGWLGQSRDINAGAGLKFEIGSIYHVMIEGMKGFALETENKAAGDSSAKYESSSSVKHPQSLPAAVLIGFGLDMG